MDEPPEAIGDGPRFYYVDEAGDPTLFGAKGQVRVGQDGCSTFFALGKLDVHDPETLSHELNALRLSLLAAPYFKDVPSMSTAKRKTALLFHAKDDVPEVRREVFSLLLRHEMRFYAVIRDKRVIVEKVLDANRERPNYRYRPNQLYDRCVPLLFDGRLHKARSHRIVFATRGSSDRTEAFRQGVLRAKDVFQRRWGIESVAPVEVIASNPARTGCLQAADYFLWALQRAFERGEHRYLDLLASKVGLVLDRDDVRQSPAGAYYSRRNPLESGFRA